MGMGRVEGIGRDENNEKGREGLKRDRNDGMDGKIWQGAGQEATPVFWQIQCFRTCSVPMLPKDRTSAVLLRSL